jgi:hypothetical protein
VVSSNLNHYRLCYRRLSSRVIAIFTGAMLGAGLGGCAILPPPVMPAPAWAGLQLGAQHPLAAWAPAQARLRAPNGTEINVEGNGDVRGADVMLPVAAFYAPRLALHIAPTPRMDFGVYVTWLNAGAQARFFESGPEVAGGRLALSVAYQIGYPIPQSATVIPTPHVGRLLLESHPPATARWASFFALGPSYGSHRHSLSAPDPHGAEDGEDDIIDIGRSELRFEVTAGIQFRTSGRRTAVMLALSPYVVASNGRGSGEPRMPGGYEVVQYRQRWGLSLTLGWLASLKRP